MKFQAYLTEGRTKGISIEEAVKLIKKDHSDAWDSFVKDRTGIFRGNVSVGESFAFVEPKKAKERRSANTTNHFTLIIDNHPKWKKYPKRSESLICTTNKHGAYHGNQYLVLPKNGGKIGIVPSADFWGGFQKTFGEDVDMFNRTFKQMYDAIGKPSTKNEDKNWNTMQKAIASMDEWMSENYIKDLSWATEGFNMLQYMRFSGYGYGPKSKISKFIDWFIPPEKNGFQLRIAGDDLPQNCEAWTDAPSLMINFKTLMGDSMYWSDDEILRIDDMVQN